MDGIDMSIIQHKKARYVSSEESLKDVKPIDWGKKILDGQVKVVVTADKRGPAEWDAE